MAFNQREDVLLKPLVALVFLLSSVPFWREEESFNYSSVCPADRREARIVLESFIKDNWAQDLRVTTGTSSLSVGQIQVLTNPTDDDACELFNTTFADAINKTAGPDNDKNYHVRYYKAGSFYFVAVAIAQPANQDYYLVGLSHLDIYDSNLDRIAGYSF